MKSGRDTKGKDNENLNSALGGYFVAFMSGAAFAADTTKPIKAIPKSVWLEPCWCFDAARGIHKSGWYPVLDPENVEASTVTAVIDATSISTGVEALDKHIKTADFLEVETYPEITFEALEVVSTGDKTADITGNLTLHGCHQAGGFAGHADTSGRASPGPVH